MIQKIIDVHTHPDFSDKTSMREAKAAGVNFSLKGIAEDFKKHNIIKAVALPEFTHYSLSSKITSSIRNDSIKKLVLKNPDKFIGACTLNPTEYVNEDICAIEDEIKKGTFRAIKLYLGYELFYPNDESCCPIYELAERNKIPVMFHTGDVWSYAKAARLKYSNPINIDEVATSFPGVKFVMCHLGNPWITDAVEVLSKNDNVYADLSGFLVGKSEQNDIRYREGRIKAIMDGIFLNSLNINKLMFGTDYPLTSYDFYIKFIRRLDLSKKEFNKIFFENASRLFNIQ